MTVKLTSEIKIIDYYGEYSSGKCIKIDGELIASCYEMYDEEEDEFLNIFLLETIDCEEPEEFDSEEAAEARLQEIYDQYITERDSLKAQEAAKIEEKKKNFLASWSDNMYDTLASVAADFCVTVDVLKRHVENNLNSIIDSYSNWNEYIDQEGFYDF